MSKFTSISGVGIGGDAPLLIIAGPCVLENQEQAILTQVVQLHLAMLSSVQGRDLREISKVFLL